jgi:hypothetical protein
MAGFIIAVLNFELLALDGPVRQLEKVQTFNYKMYQEIYAF